MANEYQAYAQSADGRVIGWDGQRWVPVQSKPTAGPVKRFATQSLGLPENVDTSAAENKAELEKILQQPGSELARGAKQFASGLNPWAGYTDTEATAARRFSQPGLANKAAGATEAMVGAVPYAGGPAVRSMEQGARGDYAGSLGSILNTILMGKGAMQTGKWAAEGGPGQFMRTRFLRKFGAGPEAEANALREHHQEASNVDAENQQIAQKNVTKTGQSFASELYDRMAGQFGDAVETMRKGVRQVFNKRWDELKTGEVASKPVDWAPVNKSYIDARNFLDNPGLQKQFDSIMKRAGIPTPKDFVDTEGGLTAADLPAQAPYGKAQAAYTALGDETYGGSGPDYDRLYHATEMVRKPLGGRLQAAHDAAGSGPQFSQLRQDYTDFKAAFDDPRAPLKQLIDAETSGKRANVLEKFAGDDTISGLLDKYGEMGANPQLSSQVRSLTRMLQDLPSSSGSLQAPKPGPEAFDPIMWREGKLQEQIASLSKPTSVYESMSNIGTRPRGLFRGAYRYLLDQPAFRNWLAGREQPNPSNLPVTTKRPSTTPPAAGRPSGPPPTPAGPQGGATPTPGAQDMSTMASSIPAIVAQLRAQAIQRALLEQAQKAAGKSLGP